MAETLAADLGLETAVLDPIEGLGDETADEDYLSLMRANLAALQKANDCSMTDAAIAASATAASSLGGRPVLRGIDLAVHARRGRRGARRQRLGQVDAGAHAARPGPAAAARSGALRHPAATRFHDWQRVGFVPQRVTADLRRPGHGAGGGRLRPARPPAAASGRCAARDRAAVRDAHRGRRPRRPGRATASPRSPAASSSGS